MEDQMRHLAPKSLIASAILFFSLLLTLAPAGGAFAATREKSQAPAPDSANCQAWLTNQVRHKLVMLPYYSVFDNLQYQVEGGKVTLLGQVKNPILKSDAEHAVKQIEGVEMVDNQLEVLPPSPFDDRIRRATYRSIYSFGS